MKKISLTANALFLVIIIFMSCNKTDLSPSGNVTEKSSVKNVSNPARTNECPGCTDYGQVPLTGINTETALMMSDNYKLLNQPLLEINGNITDANSIWFSLETLKNFIWKIEKAVCLQNCPNGINLGVRIYYGRYPEDMTGELASLDPDFAQHHTVFMVPTFQDADNSQIHWDFDPWHWGSNRCKPTTMTEWFAISPKPFGVDNSLMYSIDEEQYFMTNNGTLSSALNHGDLIPPYPVVGAAY